MKLSATILAISSPLLINNPAFPEPNIGTLSATTKQKSSRILGEGYCTIDKHQGIDSGKILKYQKIKNEYGGTHRLSGDSVLSSSCQTIIELTKDGVKYKGKLLTGVDPKSFRAFTPCMGILGPENPTIYTDGNKVFNHQMKKIPGIHGGSLRSTKTPSIGYGLNNCVFLRDRLHLIDGDKIIPGIPPDIQFLGFYKKKVAGIDIEYRTYKSQSNKTIFIMDTRGFFSQVNSLTGFTKFEPPNDY